MYSNKETEHLKITRADGSFYILNPRMIAAKDISEESVVELVKLHNIKQGIFETAEFIGKEKTDQLRVLADIFQEVEFKMQEVWGFGRDATFHEWYTFPYCSCPKMDNADARGTKYGVINCECPVHGVSNE